MLRRRVTHFRLERTSARLKACQRLSTRLSVSWARLRLLVVSLELWSRRPGLLRSLTARGGIWFLAGFPSQRKVPRLWSATPGCLNCAVAAINAWRGGTSRPAPL